MWWAGIRLPVWVTRVLNQTKWTFVLMGSLQACVFWWDFSAVGPRHQWKYLNGLYYRSKPQRPPHITLKGDHWIYLLTRLRFAEQPRTIKTSPSFLCSLFNSFRRVFIRFFLFSFLSIFFLLQTVWRQRLPLAKSGLLSVDKILGQRRFRNTSHVRRGGGEGTWPASCYLNVKKKLRKSHNVIFYFFFVELQSFWTHYRVLKLWEG